MTGRETEVLRRSQAWLKARGVVLCSHRGLFAPLDQLGREPGDAPAVGWMTSSDIIWVKFSKLGSLAGFW